MADDGQRVLSREQAAAEAGVSVSTIDRERQAGRLESHRVRRRVVILASDLYTWIKLYHGSVLSVLLIAVTWSIVFALLYMLDVDPIDDLMKHIWRACT